jgi:hypothetical protein
MPTLYAYRKASDAITTHTLRLPMPAQGEQAGQELATLADGRTIVVLFDGHDLPADQPAPIKSSIEPLPSPLPDALREEIRAASPHIQLINRRLVERIRAQYSTDDEAYFSRITIGTLLKSYTMTAGEQAAIAAYQATAEAARVWAKAERAKLGL